MPHASEVIEMLLGDSSWKGFPEVRHYIHEMRTRADARALALIIEHPAIAAREDFNIRRIRIAMAGSLSTENFRDALTLQFLDRGLFCQQYHSPFGQLAQEIRDPFSGLHRFGADMVVLIPQLSGYLPRDGTLSTPAAEQLVQAVWEDVSILRQRFPGPILVQNFLPVEFRPMGILDCKEVLGAADFYRSANLLLSQRIRTEPDVFILDAAHLAAHSAVPWTSLHKQNFLAGCGVPDQLTSTLARDIAAAGAALKGFARKCLVLDLDNTLWGGVVGEEGVAGIRIGGGFPGNIYASLQGLIASLAERGVILAVNSKNNEKDAWEVFDSRSEMVLKREHFSCARINWQDKATNLKEIARELNIGLESMVVLEDSVIEQRWIETACPETYVIPASDPLEMLWYLATTRLFDTLSKTADDALRAKSYGAAGARKRMETEASDLNHFLYSLDLVVEIGIPTPAQQGRVAQLTQKTNQFNLTTRRYSEEQIRRKQDDPAWKVFCCSCSDRFAAEGLIGVAIVHTEVEDWLIDAFLLSCRVLGRGVERAFLAWICGQAERAGARSVTGEFIRTGKNGLAERFYEDNGFAAILEKDGHSKWRLQLPAPETMWPGWICRGSVGRATVTKEETIV